MYLCYECSQTKQKFKFLYNLDTAHFSIQLKYLKKHSKEITK